MPTELLIAAPKLEKFVDIENLPCAKCKCVEGFN